MDVTRRLARQDVVVYRDPAAYCSHPCVTRLGSGEYLVAFNESLPRHPHLHPTSDPRYLTHLSRSADGGRTWSAPQAAPGYHWTGCECPAITAEPGGDVLLTQWRFAWFPLDQGRALSARGERDDLLICPPGVAPGATSWRRPISPQDWATAALPWARGDDGCYLHRSRDGGRTWETPLRVPTVPFARGYSPRPPCLLPDGTLLLPLGSHDTTPEAACYAVRSIDGGQTWTAPSVIAPYTSGRRFNEPSALALPDGRVLCLMRERVTGCLFASESADGGATWSPPVQTPIWGGPPHLLLLQDGRVACIYGYRRAPFGVRLCLSEDGGHTWAAPELVVRDDLPTANCGYPTAFQEPSGALFAVYYAEDAAGVTYVTASRVTLP